MDPVTILILGAAGLILLNKKKTDNGAVPYSNGPSGTNTDDNGSSHATTDPTTGIPTTENAGAPDSPNTPVPESRRPLSERVSTEVYPDAEWLIELLQNAERGGDSFDPAKQQINADLITYSNRPVLRDQYQILMSEVVEEESDYYNTYSS